MLFSSSLPTFSVSGLNRWIVCLLTLGSALLAQGEPTAPQNVILFIGDGMGPEQVRAANYYNGGPLSFENLASTGEVTTHDAGGGVTDSAAAATAIATGVKVNSGVISLQFPGDGSELETMLEMFQKRGKKTGLLTTAYLTHATPAGFGAHETSRGNYAAIGGDYLNQTRPNLLFGGGGNGLDAVATANSGYSVATTTIEFEATAFTGDQLAGLFGTAYMPYEAAYISAPDDYPYPHLSEMVAKALAALENHPGGFFLMVESGRIDHACHANLLAESVHEAVELGNAVQVALDWIDTHPDTLVVVTADHETGGLSVTADNGVGEYPTATFSSTGHTGVNVPVYATGPNAELVVPVMDNTDFVRLCTAESTTQPVIFRVSVNELSASSATIVWSTDEASDSLVEYRETESDTWLSVDDSQLTTDHQVVLGALTTGTTYEYQVSSSNGTVTNTSAIYPLEPVFIPDAPLTLVAEGSMWKYLDDGSNQGTPWSASGFDDSLWESGPAELGYGEGDEATEVSYGPNSSDKYVTTYFRHTFNVANPATYGELSLRLLRDDGAIVYLNGTEVHRINMPTGAIAYDTYASSASEYPWDTAVSLPNTLLAGANVLAVEVHQGNATSSDLSLDLELTAPANDPNDVQIIKGPWLQNVTADSIVVMWETDLPSASRVDYGLGAADEAQVTDDTLVTIHEVMLTNLAANTGYFYAASSGYGVSTETTFTTAPTPGADDSFRFAVYSDTQDNPDDHTAVINRMLLNTPLPRFILHAGDQVSDGLAYSDWGPQFFTPGAPLFAQAPVYPALGNQDFSTSERMWFYDFFSLPDNGTGYGIEQWYAFTYGNTRIIALNSNVAYDPTSAQYTWLANELASNAFTSATWRIVFFHHPPYSTSPTTDVQTHLVPLFHEHGVHLVFNGHNHYYRHVERTDPDWGATISYIVTGGGGATVSTPGSVTGDDLTPIAAEGVLHHCLLDVSLDSLELRALRNDGSSIDHLLLSKDDSTPPEITDVAATTTDTSATITWTTNEYSDSLVEYTIDGLTMLSASDPTFTKIHSLTITGLEDNTTYQFQVRSTDAMDNTNADQTPAYTFKTLETNDPPVADNQSVAVDEDSSTAITLTGSDPNTDDTLTYTVTAGPASGTLGGTAPNLTYTPNPQFDGTDSIQFTVNDGEFDSPAATVTITVNGVNDPPTAPTGLSATAGDRQITLSWVAAIDPDTGDTLTYSVYDDASNMVVAGLTGTGHTVTGLTNGTEYTYFIRVADSDDLTADSSPVSATPFVPDTTAPGITLVNAAPALNGTSATITWTTNEAATSQVDYRILGQTEEDWQTVSDSAPVTSHIRTLTGLAPDTTYEYRVTSVDASANGTTSDITTFTTNAVIPTADDQPVTLDEDTPTLIVLTGTDPNEESITFMAGTPSHGTLDGDGANVTYTPETNYSGPDSFLFVVSDGTFDSPAATVTITVTPVNDAPTDPSGLVATPGDGQVTLNWAAATDPDDDTLTYSVIRDTDTIIATGLVATTVTDTGLTNDTAYSYVVRTVDSGGLTADSSPVSATPQGIDPNAVVTADPTMVVGTFDETDQTLTEVRVGAAAGLEAHYTLQTPANLAQVESLTLHLDYTLAADDSPWQLLAWNFVSGTWTTLTDLADDQQPVEVALDRATALAPDGTIQVAILDGGAVKKEDYDTLTVNSLYVEVRLGTPNTPPTATSGITAGTPEDTTTGTITLSGTDPEGDPLNFRVIVAPTHGSLSGTLPNLLYTPDGDYNGTDSFQFVVNDGRSDSAPATVTITVDPVNDSPVATPQALSTEKNVPLVITLDGTDVDGDSLTYSVTQNANIEIDGNQVTYTPTTDYTGDFTFDYTVDDGNATASATITITVTDPSTAPTIRVADITMEAVPAGKNWKATATISIVDQDGQTVNGASVTGNWEFNGSAIGSVTGLTDAAGSVLLSSDPVKKVTSGTFTFTVTGVTMAGADYDPDNSVITALVDIPE